MEILALDESYWEAVANIYAQGIATHNATFQTSVPTWQDWDKSHLEIGRWIAIEQGEVRGWAALSAVSSRCVYAGVAEISVYIAESARGKGVGTVLLNKLISDSEQHGIWTLQAGIFPENEASMRLHQKNGFRIVGIREKIGQLNGIWRDTVLLERRSPHI